MGSIATVLGQRAIISADYEYVDYTSAKFTNNGSGNEYLATNEAIKTIYKGTHNFRAGAEYRDRHYRLHPGGRRVAVG